MKAVCNQADLAKGLSIVSRVVKKSSLLILENILISTRADKIVLTGTNLGTSVTVSIDADVEEQGRITIPHKIFTAVVRSLPKDRVVLSVDYKKMSLGIVTQNSRSTLMGLDALNFPGVTMLNDCEHGATSSDIEFAAPAAQLLSALKSVMVASSTDQYRPTLNSVELKLDKLSYISLVATDGFRLTRDIVTVDYEFPFESTFLVPINEVKQLVHAASDIDPESSITISHQGQWVFFAAHGATRKNAGNIRSIEMVASEVDATYPKYESIIPKEYTSFFEISKTELLRAVRVSNRFTKDRRNYTEIAVNSKEKIITIESESTERDEFRAKFDAEAKADARVRFNGQYLVDALNHIDAPVVQIKIVSALKPFAVCDPRPERENFLHLIMPVYTPE